jgi:hypothetical protein
MKIISKPLARTAVAAGLVLWSLAGGAAESTWEHVDRGLEKDLGAPCAIRSAPVTVSDGYQDISAHLVVTPGAILVRTESPLDASFSDIGLEVDRNGFVPMDGVFQRLSAQFSKAYQELMQQFKKGRTVRVQLRFWPTWPVTGAHPVSFSLLGFTKAYDGMLKSCQPQSN